MDVPNRLRSCVRFARCLVFVCLIQACLVVGVNAATSLVIFGAVNGLTNVPSPPLATNIAFVNNGYYDYAIVRNDGTAVVFNAAQPQTPAQVWTTNPPFLSLIDMQGSDGPIIGLLSNHIVYQNSSLYNEVSNAVAIYYSSPYSYALSADGTVYSWNYAADGGFHADPIASSFSNIISLSMSTDATESLALKNDGTVIQWNNVTTPVPNPPAGLSNVVGIAAGYGWGLALRNDGTVTNWGNGEFITNVPPGLSNVIAISSYNEANALALKSDGTVMAWGSGYVTPNFGGLTNVTGIGNGFAVVDTEFPHQITATNLGFTNNVFSLQVPSLSGKIYCLEYTANLSNPAWVPLPLVAGNGEMLTLTDTNATDSQRFYRVRKWQ